VPFHTRAIDEWWGGPASAADDGKPIPLPPPDPIITSEDCYKIYYSGVVRPATRPVRINLVAKTRRERGRRLNCSHSILSHARPRHAKGVLGDGLSHAP